MDGVLGPDVEVTENEDIFRSAGEEPRLLNVVLVGCGGGEFCFYLGWKSCVCVCV